MDWRHRAACRDEDPELFFPVASPGTAGYMVQVAEAKAVCHRCPVRLECLAEALATPVIGVWGGTTETDRRDLKRRALKIGA